MLERARRPHATQVTCFAGTRILPTVCEAIASIESSTVSSSQMKGSSAVRQKTVQYWMTGLEQTTRTTDPLV